MGKIQFTPEQRQVIEAGDCSLLVSAAAGSGKTAVLVQRIIEKLTSAEKPQDISRLLIVTYTNAAAAEMRERIGKRLTECLTDEEYAQNAHLQRQVLLLRNASIMTIHGFCLSLLREFFYELELDPAFRIAEEAELTLLRADVMEEMLEARYEAGEELFLRLTECIGSGKTDEMLTRQIESLYNFSQSAPFPEQWLGKITEDLEKLKSASGIPEEGEPMRFLLRHIHAVLADGEALCEKALAVCTGAEGPYPYAEAVEADRELFRALCAKKTYAEFSEAFEALEFKALSRKKCEVPEEKKEQVKRLRAAYKEMLLKLKKDYFFEDAARMAEDMAAMAPLMQTLAGLCKEYGERYAKAKEERGLLDFNDLEHLAVRLLLRETEDGTPEATETARLLRARFDEIMVDECQDSNQIQELLLWSISGEEDGRPNRFMVGDVKQSIYKFRMAKPELFMEKYEKYKEEGAYRKIVLGRNFRSRTAVVDTVNDVFSCLMQKEFGRIAYDDAAKLNPGAAYPWQGEEDNPEQRERYTTELLLTGLAGEEEEAGSDRIMQEAMTAGARIKRLLAEQLPIYDGEETGEDGERRKKFHPVSYGDIVILFRAMSGYAEPFLEVFTELGIPAVAETRSGYFTAQEVAVVLNALRVIDNPRQDIPLVSVLRSEMTGLTEEELALVRIAAKEREETYRLSFYDAVRLFLEKTAPEDGKERNTGTKEQSGDGIQSAQEKLLLFEERFGSLRELALYAGVPEVLSELYRLTSYPDFVRVKPGGERRAENLAMLAVKAKAFEESSYSGIFDFVRYIDRLIKYDTDTGEAQTAAGGDAVRLMSIHKSKGLEAPVVFVAGLSKQFNRMDARAGVVLHPELGIGMDFCDEVLRVKAPTLQKRIIAGQLNYEMLSEELRILYVALTRAKEKLILSAAVPSEEKFFKDAAQEACEGQAGYLALFSANSYLDFLKLPLNACIERGSLRLSEAESSVRQAEEAVAETEREALLRKERFLKISAADTETVYDEGLAEELAARAGYAYPYPPGRGKRKLSVSELKRAAYQEEDGQEELFPEPEPEKTVPRFLQEKPEEMVSGSERGTLYHRVMQCMDFCRDYKDEAAVSEELQRLVQAGLLRQDAGRIVSARKLLQFFTGSLGVRMQKAARERTLKKEQPFVIGIPYREVYREEGAEENTDYVMVQGMIDACFEENGALVLVDYKTDSVRENVQEVLTKRYRTQIDYYERALRQITGKPVAERIIYAFANGEAFPVEREEAL